MAADVDMTPYEDVDFSAWAAYRQTKKSGKKKKEEGDPGKNENRAKGEVRRSMAHGAPGPMLLVRQRIPFGAEMLDGGCTSKCVCAKSPVFAHSSSTALALSIGAINGQRAR